MRSLSPFTAALASSSPRRPRPGRTAGDRSSSSSSRTFTSRPIAKAANRSTTAPTRVVAARESGARPLKPLKSFAVERLGRRRAALSLSTSAAVAVALVSMLAAGVSPPPVAAFENDRDMLDEHTPESAFIFATIRAHRVVIFSKSYCPYCRAVKKIFAEEYPEETPFVVELDEREDMGRMQDAMQRLYGTRTVPQVFVRSQRIGGSDDTINAHVSGKLRVFLGGAAGTFPLRRDHVERDEYMGGPAVKPREERREERELREERRAVTVTPADEGQRGGGDEEL